MEDLGKWRTWGNGGSGEMEDLGNDETGEMEDLGKWRAGRNGKFGEMEET
jgi:hypothetical protein